MIYLVKNFRNSGQFVKFFNFMYDQRPKVSDRIVNHNGTCTPRTPLYAPHLRNLFGCHQM